MERTRYSITPGVKIAAYASTFPARRYWYRHDTVTANGVVLEGCIQVRCRNGRTESITCYRDSCVIGSDAAWLERMNHQTTTP